MKITVGVLATLVAVPAWADPAYFSLVRKGQLIRVMLPSGYCDARVQQRDADRLTLKLKKTTTQCGQRGTTVSLSRNNVREVFRNQPSHNETKHLVVLVATFPLIVAFQAVVYATESLTLGLATLFAGFAGLELLWPRPPQYEIVADQVTS